MAKRIAVPLGRFFIGLIFLAFIALVFTTSNTEGTGPREATEQPFLAGSDIPAPVRTLLQRACQNCHSENTSWPWYGGIPPVSWQIQTDVAKARAFMNFSKWRDYSDGERRGLRTAIGAAIESRHMPPPRYLWMHREARLSKEELALVKAWAFTKIIRSNQIGLENNRAIPHR